MSDTDALIESLFDPDVFSDLSVTRKAGEIFELESYSAPRDLADIFLAKKGWEIPFSVTIMSNDNGWGVERGVAVHAGSHLVAEWTLSTPEYCDDECDGTLEATVFQCASESDVQERVRASTDDIVNTYFLDKISDMRTLIARWPKRFMSTLRNMVDDDTDQAIVQTACDAPEEATLEAFRTRVASLARDTDRDIPSIIDQVMAEFDSMALLRRSPEVFDLRVSGEDILDRLDHDLHSSLTAFQLANLALRQIARVSIEESRRS